MILSENVRKQSKKETFQAESLPASIYIHEPQDKSTQNKTI